MKPATEMARAMSDAELSELRQRLAKEIPAAQKLHDACKREANRRKRLKLEEKRGRISFLPG